MTTSRKKSKQPKPTKLALRISQKRKDGELKFTEFTNVRMAPKTPVWKQIRSFYGMRDIADRAIGLILNGIESDRKRSFLLSRRTLAGYFAMDPNIKRSTLNGEDSKRLMATLLANKTLNCLVAPDKTRSRNGEPSKAGLYTLGDPELIALFDWWNENTSHNTSHKSTPETETDTETEAETEVEAVSETETKRAVNLASPLALKREAKSAIEEYYQSGDFPKGFLAWAKSTGYQMSDLASDEHVEHSLETFFERQVTRGAS